MYGLIQRINSVPGKRRALIEVLIRGSALMPGCLSYIVAKDPNAANAIWVTEAWESKEKHDASLSLPAVQRAITEGKPLMAGFGERIETEPVGGHGLVG